MYNIYNIMFNNAKDSYDNVYYNVVIDHDDSQGPTPSVARYNVQKDSPIIDNCNDYYLSVINFSIPMNEIPTTIIKPLPGSFFTNETPLRIGIIIPSGTTYETAVIFTPDDLEEPQPNQNNPNNVIVTPYYYVYSYESVINMINTALSTSYLLFKTANAGLPQAIANVSPFFYYDINDSKIKLVIHNSWNSTSIINPVQIYINLPLQNYLDGFDFKINKIAGITNLFFVIYYTGNNGYLQFNTFLPPAVPTFIVMSQNYNAISLWDSLKRLILTSSTIPVLNEQIPVGNFSPSLNSGLPVVADYIPQLENPGEARSTAYYTPTAQYRLVNMNKNGPLQNIDINILWQDKDGDIHPLLISIFSQATIKIGFFKKGLYKPSSILTK